MSSKFVHKGVVNLPGRVTYRTHCNYYTLWYQDSARNIIIIIYMQTIPTQTRIPTSLATRVR